MTSDLTSRILEAEERYAPGACKYATILAKLDERERNALNSTPLPSSHVARIVRAFGHDVSERLIQRHRAANGGCGCHD